MTIPIDRSGDGSGPWEMVAAPIGVPSAPSVTNWCQNYSTALLADVKLGKPADGIIAAVGIIGEVLAEHFPKSSADTNEIPDKLIEL